MLGRAHAARAGSYVARGDRAPLGVSCIRVEVVGTRAVERSFDVAPGESTTLHLNGLPLGTVLVAGEAFGVACDLVEAAHVPGWIGDLRVKERAAASGASGDHTQGSEIAGVSKAADLLVERGVGWTPRIERW